MSATRSAPTAAPDLGAVVNEAVSNEGRSASWTSERASAALRMYGRPSGSNLGALQRFVSRSRNGVLGKVNLAFGGLGVMDSRYLGLLYSAAPESESFITILGQRLFDFAHIVAESSRLNKFHPPIHFI